MYLAECLKMVNLLFVVVIQAEMKSNKKLLMSSVQGTSISNVMCSPLPYMDIEQRDILIKVQKPLIVPYHGMSKNIIFPSKY